MSALAPRKVQTVLFNDEEGVEVRSPWVTGNTVLKKDNRLIRASVSAPVTPHTWTILSMALAKLACQQPGENRVAIGADEVRALPGYGSRDWRANEDLDRAGEQVLNLRLTIESANPLDPEAEKQRSNIVIGTNYRRGRLMIEFNPSYRELVAGLTTGFTAAKLGYISSLCESVHAQHLYEYLLSYARRSRGQTEIAMSVKDLRMRAMVEEGKHVRINDLDKYVVASTVAAINKWTDLDLNYERRGRGAERTFFVFSIAFKAAEIRLSPLQRALFIRMSKAGVNYSVSQSLIDEFGVDRIVEALIRYEEPSGDKGSTRSAGWLITAIREGYEIKDYEARPALIQRYKAEILRHFFEALSHDDKRAITAAFTEHLQAETARTGRSCPELRLIAAAGRPTIGSAEPLFYAWLMNQKPSEGAAIEAA